MEKKQRGKGYPHGGNGKTAKEVGERQDKFVEKLTNSPAPQSIAKDAAVEAGYSPKTHVTDLIKPGSVIHEKAIVALEKKGITWDKIAEEYDELMTLAKSADAKDMDLKALATGLKQLGWLMQGGREKMPQVAVQINNGIQSSADGTDPNDPGAIRKLLGEVEASCARIEEAIERGGYNPVHAGDAGIIDAETCEPLVRSDREAQEDTDRGES